MKKRLLAIMMAVCMVVSLAPTVFAKTFEYADLPTYLAEQDEGLYIAAQKITESGYYLLTPMASGTTDGVSALSSEGASESNYHVYADLENRTLTLNNAAIEIATPLTNTVNDKPDMTQDPVGVLCETRGTATSDSGASTAFQTLNNYSLVTAGIAVLNQTGDWTITLIGASSIDIDSKFAAPNRNAHHAMPVYGIYIPGGSLTVNGEGSLDADVANNQNSRSEGLGYCNPACGIYSADLNISKATVDISTSTDRGLDEYGVVIGQNLSLYYNSGSYTYAAVLSTGEINIDDGADVSVADTLNRSTGIAAAEGITVSGGETAVSVATAGASVSGIGETYGGCAVTITDGASVTVTGTGGDTVGIAGTTLTIEGSTTEVEVTVTGDESVGIAGENTTISAVNTTVTAGGEGSQAVSGTNVTVSAGTYSTPIDGEYLAEGTYQVNGTVTDEMPDNVTAFIGTSLFTGSDGGNKAIAAVSIDGGEVWLNADTTADRTGLTIGNKVTVYLAKGAKYTGTFSGDGITAQITEDGQETRDGVTYDKYIYKMVADSDSAPIKVIKADGSESYYNSFDGDGAYGTGVSSNLSEGDTIVLLDDIELYSDISIGEENVTLDLNGKTLSNPNGGVITAKYGSVIIVDNSTEKTGKVVAGGKYGKAVDGSAVIRGGTFEGAEAVYGGGDYDITIYGGKFIGELAGTLYIHDGDFSEATLEDTHSSIESYLTKVSLGGSLTGQSDTDVLSWSVAPNGDTVTVDGMEWPALTLTFKGNGAMGDYSTYNRPWCCFNGQITKVVVEEGVTRIGRSAFEEFKINNSFTIPASLTEIPAKTFYNCNITEYIVSSGNTDFTAENGVLFNADRTTLIAYPDAAEPLAEYVIPDTVTKLQGFAFYGSDLKSLTLPANWDMDTSYGIGKSTDTDDYRYVGWYKDNEYTNKLTSMGGDVYVPAECKGTTIYAKWVSDITLDANGGELDVTSLEVAHGKAIGELPGGTREGYSLVGWNTQADGCGTAVAADTIPTGHDTYYAIWGKTSSVGNKSVTVLGIPDEAYTGNAITPAVYYTVDGGEQQIAENVTYENNINVGTATAKFVIDGTETSVTFNIVKASYDTTGMRFDNKSFDYDGTAHYLEVVGLPEGVTVAYEGNGQTERGRYTVTAKFTVPAGYEEIADKTATLTINRAYVKFVADSKTMYVGEDVPKLTYKVISQVTGEPVDYDFSFTPVLTCSAEGDTVGEFPIRVSGVTNGSYGNYYVIGCENGTLTVEIDTSIDFESFWFMYIVMIRSQKFDITAAASEGGTITPDGVSEVRYGKSITYTITPDEGYAIADVFVDGESVGAVAEYTLTSIKDDHTIIAVFAETAWKNPFTDISGDAWYYEDIEYAYENDLMIGTSTDGTLFSPDELVNRAMLVTVLWRLEGSPAVDGTVDFTDVPAGEWYAEAVSWAAANDIVLGYGDGTFGPDDELTREQVMAILHRYVLCKEYDEGKVDENAASITKQCVYNDWAEEHIAWADMSGMFCEIGVDVTDMRDEITRAEIAAYLRRFCDYITK